LALDPEDPNVNVHRVELPPVQSYDDWRSWPLDAKQKLLAKLEWEAKAKAPLPYFDLARPKQLPPEHPSHHLEDSRGFSCGCSGVDDDWMIWLLMAGRGIGKTFVGSNWILSRAITEPGEYAVLAPTFNACQKTCFGNAIIPALKNAKIDYGYRRNELELSLPNGSVIYGFTADNPEKVRGYNLSGAWCDELGSWRYSETWYAALVPAVRKGLHPRIVVTTTPRPTDLMLDLVSRDDGTVHLTRGTTFENQDNLSAIALAEMKRRYEGTRLGLQELEGQLLEDIEGALWTRDMISSGRLKGKWLDTAGTWHDDLDLISLERVVVGYDPAGSDNPDSDEHGIVVAGVDYNGHGYILADYSLKGTPNQACHQLIKAYNEWHADCIVAEVNHGADWVPSLIATVDENVPVRTVRASRGKALRAEPVASLYNQGRVHHYGTFADLETQMTRWTPHSSQSPDRLDALVWAITELKGLQSMDYAAAYGTVTCQRCARGYVFASHPKACPFCHAPT